MKEEKILVITSAVENCDTDVNIINEYMDIFDLVGEDVATCFPQYAFSLEEMMHTLKEKGCFNVCSSWGDSEFTLTYSEFGSVFGTETITFKIWENDDILSRKAIAYIVMP